MASEATPSQDMQEAVTLMGHREFSHAVDVLLEIQERIPNPDILAKLLAFAYLGWGNQLLEAGDFSGSRNAFQKGRFYGEDEDLFWHGEAMSSYRLGQYPEAAFLLEQAIGIDPQNAEYYYLLGVTYYADGRMSEALDALTRANELRRSVNSLELLDKVRREWHLEQGMSQEVRGHFQLSFFSGVQSADLVAGILETLEEAYNDLGSKLAYYPAIRVPVLLYSHQEFAAVTNSPDWASAVYDGKIRLPLDGISKMNDHLAAVLYHEYVHALVQLMANQNAPVWLNEGLAELVGRTIFSPPLLYLQNATDVNLLIDWDSLAMPFSGMPGDKALLAYEQSYLLVEFMVDRFGWHKISELLERLGKYQEWKVAIADVYREYGLDWSSIVKEWQNGVR
jgi:tetratricopeptide (TPR) repeat protein